WGLNNVGQVGDGAASANACTCRAAPVQTAVGAGNAELGAGWFHAFALEPVAAVAAGANQVLYGDNLRFNFAQVTTAGSVAYTAISASAVAAGRTVPAGYTIQTNQPAYDVTTTAVAGGPIDVCIANLNEFSPTAFDALKILNGEGGAWVDRTQSANFMKREICARVSTLSQFVIATGSTVTPRRAPFDFDGDNKTDVGIFRQSDGSWWYARSSATDFRVFVFGAPTDIPVPGDYTGDGKADIAVFRPSTGEWFVQRSEDNSYFSFPFGQAGDVPVPTDYDADGKTDFAIFRPASGTWFITSSNGSGTGIVNFGAATDKPVPADFDGDGKADVAIFRPSDGSWWYLRSSDLQFRVFIFGVSTDIPVPGDYSGDGKSELAVFRPATGEWFFQRSEDNSYYSLPFGAGTDVVAPGDYDGDGKYDMTVFRPGSGNWFIQGSSAGTIITSFGGAGDRPIANAYVPQATP
ncbi:MAG TPA: VCBS repeat-containing protein, partial [Pyrinomonadaceae bacterium]